MSAYAFSGAEWNQIFPYFLQVDRHLHLCDMGDKLRKSLPETQTGDSLFAHFELVRPAVDQNFESIKELTQYLFVLQAKNTPLLLRSQIMIQEDHILFLASPWFTDRQELKAMGIKLHDLPLHNTTADFMTLLSIQKTALKDTQELANNLQQQRQELEKTHEQLKQQEADARKLALIASRTQNMVILTNAQGEIEWVNEAYTQVTGYELEESLGKKPGHLLQGPDSDPEIVSYMSERIAAKEGFQVEIINYTKAKDPYWAEVEVQAIHDAHGNLSYFMAIESDITRRKRAELELQRYTSALREMQKLLTEPHTLLRHKVLALLKLGLQTLNMQEASIRKIGTDKTEVLHQIRQQDAQTLADEHLKRLDQEVLELGQATSFTQSLLTTLVEAPTQITGYLGIPLILAEEQTIVMAFWTYQNDWQMQLHDLDLLQLFSRWLGFEINRENSRQAMSQAKEIAERANQSKTDFIANMSHEIRTPLNAIMGMTELMQDTSLSFEQQHYMDTIWKGSQALLHLLNDLLDISKVEAGQVDIEHIDFNPQSICEEALSLFSSMARDKGLELFMTQKEPNAPIVLGDPNRLRQILVNLLSNALKFTEQGEVKVALNWDIQAELCQLHIQVSDTGLGIPEEKQSAIFEKFSQAHTHSQSLGGVGLGLNISQTLARYMSGEIRLLKSDAKGSQFEIAIPLPLRQSPEVVTKNERVILFHSIRRASLFYQLFKPYQSERNPPLDAEICEAIQAHFVVLDAQLPAEELQSIMDFCEAHFKDLPLLLFHTPLSQKQNFSQLNSEKIVHIYPPFLPSSLESYQQTKTIKSTTQKNQNAPLMLLRPQILVVEDNPDNQKIVERWLTDIGYLVDLAENGLVGSNKVKEKRYDVILMDLQMPQIDGIEATAIIRDHERKTRRKPTPILAFTAHALDHYRQQAEQAGMQGFITKPLIKERLISALAEFLPTRFCLLHVDDDEMSHTIVKSYLKDIQDLKLLQAKSSIECLSTLQSHPVNGILLDLNLPDDTGWNTLRALQEIPEFAKIPIIALTGHTGNEIRDKCLKAGFKGYLAKPYTRNALLDILNQHMFKAFEALHVQAQENEPILQEEHLDKALLDAAVEVMVIPDEVVEFMPQYISNTRIHMQKAFEHFENGEYKALQGIAHILKGSGSSFGFRLISQLSRDIENHLTNQNYGPILPLLNQMDYYFEAACRRLQR